MSQLSEVFWEKTVIEMGMESSSPMLLFITIGWMHTHTHWPLQDSCKIWRVLAGHVIDVR